MALTDENIADASSRYSREYDRYVKLADVVFHICQEIVRKLTIRASVQRRAKDPKSFIEKLKKPENRQRFNSVDDVFNGISDLVGVRIITYLESDRESVIEQIKKEFTGKNSPDIEVDFKDRTEVNKHYRATHCQVYLTESHLLSPNENLKDTTCEIQVCSILAHVFNEIEHDLQYKPLSGEISSKEQELINQLGLLTKSGDITIKGILSAADERLKVRTGEFQDVHDFVVRMRDVLSLGEKFSNNASELYDDLIVLDLNTPEKIRTVLLDGQPENELLNIVRSTFEKLKAYLNSISNNELEDESSDLLLCALLSKKCSEILQNHPTGRGNGRPGRIARIARLYSEMPEDFTA